MTQVPRHRIVLPRELRPQHGDRSGTTLALPAGSDGRAIGPVSEPAAPGMGLEWRDGLLVCTATATADLTNIAAFRDTSWMGAAPVPECLSHDLDDIRASVEQRTNQTPGTLP